MCEPVTASTAAVVAAESMGVGGAALFGGGTSLFSAAGATGVSTLFGAAPMVAGGTLAGGIASSAWALPAFSTFEWMSLAGNIASGGMQVMGKYQQAQAAKGNAAYMSQVYANNAIIAKWQAADIIKRGNIESGRYQVKIGQLLGSQKAVLGHSGFDANTDDAIDILADTREIGALDAATIRNNAERDAWGAEVRANSASAQGQLYGGMSDQINPGFVGATSALAGAGTVADKWYTFEQKRPV